LQQHNITSGSTTTCQTAHRAHLVLLSSGNTKKWSVTFKWLTTQHQKSGRAEYKCLTCSGVPKANLVFNLWTKPAKQIIFITRIYNELIDGRTFLLSPTAVAASYDEPQMFIKFYQLHYDPFITNCLEIMQIFLIYNFQHSPSLMR
jgi:hypothetical protein